MSSSGITALSRRRLPRWLGRKTGMSHFLPSDAGFGGRSSDRLAKLNERLKLGKPGRALNGDLWVVLPPGSNAAKVWYRRV